MKKSYLLAVVFIGLLFLVGCAAGSNTAVHTAAANGSIAGFWLGLWHGTIAPFTFLISLGWDSVSFYEVHNNGGWYNFGFVLGAGLLSGGTKAATSKKKEKSGC